MEGREGGRPREVSERREGGGRRGEGDRGCKGRGERRVWGGERNVEEKTGGKGGADGEGRRAEEGRGRDGGGEGRGGGEERRGECGDEDGEVLLPSPGESTKES